MFRRVGVRGRLLAAFLGISVFALIAVAAAMYSFSEVGGVLGRITGERVPAALDALELSRQAERIAAAAPKLLSVTSADEHAELSAEIATEVTRLDQLYRDLSSRRDVAGLDALGDDIARMGANLNQLDATVAELLALAGERRSLLRDVLVSTRTARRGARPGRVLIESRLAEWRRSIEDPEPLWTLIESAELNRTLNSMLPLQRAELVIATLAEMTLDVAAADDSAKLSALAAPVERSLQQLVEHTASFPPSMRTRAERQLATFERGLLGRRGLIVVRRLELQALERAQTVLDENAMISERLTLAADGLVAEASSGIAISTADAASVHTFSSRFLIAVALLSLVSSGIIVWLYVDRNLLRRLTALSGGMLAVAGGNLRVPLPPAEGADEVAEMTRALTVFRDTAVEIEEKGLREIGRARQRLIDAIESISEGFSFYGPDDRLEICNSRYSELLYGGTEIKVEPGITFEAMIRRAVGRGLVDVQGNPEVYIEERLAQHRNPGPPRLQRRTDGRWIMVAERRVSGAGTVAVYSDITELKQREMELEEAKRRTEAAATEIGSKHRELEALSSKLAKYLSPQVYASIFEGRQEVRLASQRKKLTVFFSDIAGFTEIADRLESEELTYILNHYLTEMTRIATEYGATVDKYVGDAIMIFFGDPETQGVAGDALACVKMALAMQERMEDLGAIWRDAGIEQPLRCRIGVHTGYCTVGNFGSEDRMDYTIHGTTVNLASRLESEAQPGSILISYETYAHVRDEVLCEEIGRIQVRGIAHPVASYRAIALRAAGQRTPIRSDLPHLRLDADPERMSAEERRRAAELLQEALDRIVPCGPEIATGGEPPPRPSPTSRARSA